MKTPRRSLLNRQREIEELRSWAVKQFPSITKSELKHLSLLSWIRKRFPLAREGTLRKCVDYLDDMAERGASALAVYQPTDNAQQFHKCTASIAVASGGNQCLGGDTIIQGRRIDEIKSDFNVWSHCPKTGQRQRRMASAPYRKSFGSLYRVTLSNGQWFTASSGHQLLSACGQWMSLSACAWQLREAGVCHLASSSEFYLSGFPRDVDHLTDKASSCPESYSQDLHRYDERPRPSSRVVRGTATLSVDAPGYIRVRSNSDAPVGTQGYSRSCHQRRPLSITSIVYEREGIIYDLQVDVNANYVLADAIHHNSGKSVAAAIEFVRCLLGKDPFGKYPKPRERDGLIGFCVGYDQDHIGRHLHRYLFRYGMFDVIRDFDTGQWRPYLPDDDEDRESERMPSPPLIPKKSIKSLSWAHKGSRAFKNVILKNGSEFRAFSSKGEAPQGNQVNIYWIDEDLADDEWVPESLQRLSKRRGRLIWSALPKSRNTSLMDMLEYAESEEIKEKPDCVAFKWSFLDNPYIPSEEKRKRVQELEHKGEDVLRLRIYGDPIAQRWLVYHQFSMATHGIDREELPGGTIPHDWCRYKITDPGRSRAGVLFFAVPPPDSAFVKRHGGCVVVYRELVILQNNSAKYGEAVKKVSGDEVFYEWVMDEHHGRKHDEGPNPKTIKEYYSEALAEHGMQSQAHGARFVPAVDDIHARVEAVTDGLIVRGDGTTYLRFLRGALPEFEREIRRYRNKVEPKTQKVTDVPDKKKGLEIMDCLEYGAAHKLDYVKPVKRSIKIKSRAMLRWEAKQKKRKPEQQVLVLG